MSSVSSPLSTRAGMTCNTVLATLRAQMGEPTPRFGIDEGREDIYIDILVGFDGPATPGSLRTRRQKRLPNDCCPTHDDNDSGGGAP